MHSIILEWLWKHKPDLAIICIIVVATAWISVRVNDFVHRIESTEHLVNDINNHQLPEIRTELKEIRTEIKNVRTEMDERMDRIEVQLATIITYLNAKGK